MNERAALGLDTSYTVMPFLFALFCFVVAGFAFFAAFIAVQVWLAATILMRLYERSYVRAALWSCVWAFSVLVR